jgi:hypothetical protein
MAVGEGKWWNARATAGIELLLGWRGSLGFDAPPICPAPRARISSYTHFISRARTQEITMRRSARFAVAALFSTIASCTALGTLRAADLTTVLPATPHTITARQMYGAKLTYHFDAVPMTDDCIIHTTILSAKGAEVGGGLAQPPSTLTWSGRTDVTKWVGLPDMPPAYGKTGDPLPDGTYTIWLNLQHDGKTSTQFTGDPALKHDPKYGYEVAELKIDHSAPIPKLIGPKLDLSDYKMTWGDEFNSISVSASGPCGTGPGETKWMAHTPSHGDFGDAHFVDPTPDFPFTVSNGILAIHVKKIGNQWQGGLLSSVDYHGHGFSQKYGYFEMKAKLAKGTGTWPAFWLLSQPGVGQPPQPNVVGSEIDILEQYGHWPNILNATTHMWHQDGSPNEAVFEGYVVPGMTDGFHTYGALITPDTLSYYYDRVKLRTEKTPESAKVPMYVLVNFTLGPGWPLDKTPTDMEMLVDYVHVYAKK